MPTHTRSYYDVLPDTESVTREALNYVRRNGFEITGEGLQLLAEMIEDGHRRLATERLLDVADEEQERIVRQATTNLQAFTMQWMQRSSSQSGQLLTGATFLETRSTFCPVFPFD